MESDKAQNQLKENKNNNITEILEENSTKKEVNQFIELIQFLKLVNTKKENLNI